MDETTLLDEAQWNTVLGLLPEGYEDSARALGALVRRRAVRSAGDLLRLALAYAACDLSLRGVAGWAEIARVARLSDVALLRRLENASLWLAWLVGRMLLGSPSSGGSFALPVRILDATVVSEAGPRSMNWRIHTGWDLESDRLSSVEVTDVHGGETFKRHTVTPGEVLVADRGYAHPRGVAHVLDHGGHVLVRLNWQNFPLRGEADASGERPVVTPLGLMESLAVGEVGDADVWFARDGRLYPMRLIAYRKCAEPTKKDIQEIRYEAKRKKRTADPRTFRAACFVFVLTDLDRETLPADDALQLYRLRWRIETAFKRYKSILNLDHLRAHDPNLVTTYLYTKLLAGLLLDRLEPEDETESDLDDPFPPLGRPSEDSLPAHTQEPHEDRVSRTPTPTPPHPVQPRTRAALAL